MDETLRKYWDYALLAWQGTEWSTILVAGFMFLMIWLVAYYRSERYQEQMVSKRSMKARRKAATEVIEQKITEALEAAHKSGDLPREEADAAYEELKRNTRFRSVGIEPTFGPPYYEKIVSKAADVKKGIIRRLKAAGVNVNTALHSMKHKRKEAPTNGRKRLADVRQHTIKAT